MIPDKMVILEQAEYEKLLSHARACLPEEACGLLGGTIDECGRKHIERVYLLENADHSREHFTLRPQDQLAAVKDMRSNGWVPLGNWHSHPESPSRPSEEDRRLAYDSRASYMILSLLDRNCPILNSFHIEDASVEKEVLCII